MKKIIKPCTLILSAWLIIILEGSAFGQSAQIFLEDAAQKCRLLDDNMQRLLCFDALFETPLATSANKTNEMQVKQEQFLPDKPKLERPISEMIVAMERERHHDFADWQMSIRRWQGGHLVWNGVIEAANLNEAELIRRPEEERNPIDIFMTMPETDVSADRSLLEKAMLLVSCDNDITTLGVLLPKPINTLSANLSLSGPGGVLHRLNWRNVEGGSLVIAGRGLESIDTIKAIANYQRIQFQVNYPEGSRAFVFNMHNLKLRLRAFRLACHW